MDIFLGQTPAVYKAHLQTFFPENIRAFDSATEDTLETDPESLKLFGRPMEVHTDEEVRDYLEGIRTSDFVRKHWPKEPGLTKPKYLLSNVHPYDGMQLHGGATTDLYNRILTFTPNGFAATKASMIHELAHLIDYDTRPSWGSSSDDPYFGHGRRYARINVMLVEEFIGKDKGLELEEHMLNNGAIVASVAEAEDGEVGGNVDEIFSRLAQSLGQNFY